MKIKYILLLVILMTSLGAYSQRTYRHYLRSGDKHYADSSYTNAIVDYKKALEMNPEDFNTRYNLIKAKHCNLMQSRAKEIENGSTSEQDSIYKLNRQEIAGEYEDLAEMSDEKKVKSEMYHNIGTMYHNDGDYKEAIEAYKKALRNNPNAEDTRYNLAHALEQIRQEQSQQQQQQQDQQQNEENQQQDQQQQNDQQQDQQQQQQQNEQQQERERQEREQQKQNKIERIMNIANQNEKETQEKVQEVYGKGRVTLEKDW